MKIKQLDWFKERELEERYAMIILVVSVIYFLLNIVLDFSLSHVNPITLVLGILTIMASTAIYFMLRGRFQVLIIRAFTFLILGAFCFLLPLTSGPTGGISYSFQVLCVITIILARGRMKVVIGMILITMVIVIQSDLINYQGNIEPTSLHIDFLLNFCFIILVMYFFKNNLDREEFNLARKNKELNQLNDEMQAQGEDLEKTNHQIERIRNHLQEEVILRTEKLEEENKRLLEYSFINAHLVRAPIANLLAITQMNEENPKLEDLKEAIERMDAVVHKIANVIKIKDSTR